MAYFNKNKLDVSESASSKEREVWSGVIGLGIEPLARGSSVNDTLVVLLIATATLCGAALVGAVLFMVLW